MDHLARVALAVVVLTLVFGLRQSAGAETARVEAEYLALQAGFFDRQTLRPTEEAVRSIDAVLQKIRAQYPAVGAIRAFFSPRTMLMVRVPESVFRPFCPARPGPIQARPAPAALSLPDVDQLTQRFGGTYRIQCGLAVSVVLVDFPDLLHVPSLLALYRGTRPVIAADENELLGGSDEVEVRPAGRGWDVRLSHGWGDCLAGCIHREDFFFRVEPDGSVKKTGERRR